MLYAVMILAWHEKGHAKTILHAFDLMDAEHITDTINREFRDNKVDGRPRREARVVTRVRIGMSATWLEVSDLSFAIRQLEEAYIKHRKQEEKEKP